MKFNMASMACIIYTTLSHDIKNRKYISYFENRNFIDFAINSGQVYIAYKQQKTRDAK